MKEKKIVIFIPSVEGGGVEKNFFLISNYLSKSYNNISIITADKSIKKYLSKKIRLIAPLSNYWKKKSRYPKYFICSLYLFRFLVSNKNVLIFSFQANAYAIILAKLFRIKIITRSNSSSEGWSKSFIKKILYKIILNLSDKVIVNSYQFKKELDKKFRINSYAIYNPLNIQYIKRKSKEKTNLNFFRGNYLKIITIGRLVDQKDHLTILKSINLLDKKSIRLLIIGRGDNKEKLIQYIKENKLGSKIKLIPFQRNPYKFLRQADIFLLSSKFEGLPNVLLEAQCLKKYIISTDCPTGPKEILLNGKAGDLVPIGDYKKLSDKINKYEKKNIYYKRKILLGYKKLYRFDYNYNMKKYYNSIKKFIYT